MPSPFPGMDPYLENPSIWPDFHHALSTEIRNALKSHLPSLYYARVEMRPEVGIVEEGQEWMPPSHHYFVEIRDSNQGRKLITLVEILSPSNKKNGPDRRAYVAKQAEALRSDANLIEIDLLRKGKRVLSHPEMDGFIGGLSARTDYLISVTRAWKRHEESIGFLLFPLSIQTGLPCIPVPLRENLPEVPLDLQYVFNRAYDGGPYRRGAVDYTQPPDPPLSDLDADWALGLLRQSGLAGAPTG